MNNYQIIKKKKKPDVYWAENGDKFQKKDLKPCH
jgi:hypothetical protein